MVFLKALAKTLFHFFSGWVSCVSKKNESVFCGSAIEIQIIFLCGGGFLLFILSVGCPLAAVSSRLVCPKLSVQSWSV